MTKSQAPELERQRERVSADMGIPVPCPNCTIPLSQADAKIEGEDSVYRCPACDALLRFVMPFVKLTEPGWLWDLWPGQVNPWSEGIGRLLAGDDLCQAQDMPRYVRESLTALRAEALQQFKGRGA